MGDKFTDVYRVHLKHDLCPYVCTFPDCAQPDTLYENRDQWAQHEQWSHMCSWRCPEDETEFEDLTAYEDHVKTQHPAGKNRILSDGMLATQRFLAERQSRSCPFCEGDLDGSKEMCDHIASHLETVALLAIPPLEDLNLEPNSDAASSEAAGKDAGGSRKNDFDMTLPVVFPENDESDDTSTAERGLSESNFNLHLARLPEEAVNQSVWIADVIDGEAWDPVPKPSGLPSSSAASLSSQLNESTNNPQQEYDLRPIANLPCFIMENHSRYPNFWGREEILEELDNVLLPTKSNGNSESESGRSALLCGLGGIGKTSIAKEFAYSRRKHFNAIFWISATTSAELEHDFEQIAIQLRLVDSSKLQDSVELRTSVQYWLQYSRNIDKMNVYREKANWLLIFDENDQPELLDDYWPIPNKGSILITSRNQKLKSLASLTVSIDIQPLSDEESASLIRHLCPHANEVDISRMVQMLSGIPLAINQAAIRLRQSAGNVDQYLRDFRDQIVIDSGIEELEPRPRALLEVCATLDPDTISEQIFTLSIPEHNILGGLLLSRQTYSSARSILLQLGLIEFEPKKNCFQIHRIVHSLIRSRFRDEKGVLSASFYLLNKAWGSKSTYPLIITAKSEKLVPHVIQVARLVRAKDICLDVPMQKDLVEILVVAGW